jgi:PAS domain S-box-containing protein
MLKSFRNTLVLVILISASLPVLVFSVLHVKKIYEITHAAALKELELTAKVVSDSIEHEMDIIITRLLSLSANRDMAVATRKSVLGVRHYLSGQASDSIKEFIFNNPLVSSLYLLDTDLETALAAPESIKTVSPSPVLKYAEDLFHQKSNTSISKYTVLEFNNEDFLNKTLQMVSNKNKANRQPDSSWGIIVLVPVVLDVTNEIKGLLTAIVPFENLANHAFSKEEKKTTSLAFFKDDTLIISRGKLKTSEIDDTISGEVFFQIRNPKDVKNIKYGIRILEPSDIRLAEASRSAEILTLYIICALVLLMIIAFAFARRMTSPLDELTNVVSTYADGNYDAEPSKVKFSEFQKIVNVLGSMGKKIISQITDLKKAEQKYRGIFENASEGIFQTTLEGQFLTVNPAMTQIFGYDSSEEFINSIADLGTQFYVDSSRRDELLNLLKKDGFVKDFEFKAYRKDRTIIDVSINCQAIKDDNRATIRLEGTIIDVTEKNRVEKELKQYREHLEELVAERTKELEQSEHKITAMSQAVDDALVMINGQGEVLFWNSAAERLFGYSTEEAMGMDFHEMAAPAEVRERAQAGIKEFAASGQGLVFGSTIQTFAINRKDETFPVEVNLSPFQVDDEWFAVGTVRDITERKKAEEAIKESEKRVQTILDSISTGVIVIDPENRLIVDVNPVAARMIGLAKDDIIGRKCHHFICPRAEDDCPIIDLDQQVDNAERVLVTAGGEEIPILKTVTPIVLGGKKHLLESFADITERKRAEEELQQNLEELERFSQLTVGREKKMIELKEEINDLMQQMGKENKYKIVAETLPIDEVFENIQ